MDKLIGKKIEAVKVKRGYANMYCIPHYPGWFRRIFGYHHCGQPMIRIEILIEDHSCAAHLHYRVGPVDEFVCACSDCNYMKTEEYMM